MAAAAGGPGAVELSDGSKLRGKGRQKIENGKRLKLSLPGGGGYGDPRDRDRDQVRADLEAGYITEDQAKADYGLEL